MQKQTPPRRRVKKGTFVVELKLVPKFSNFSGLDQHVKSLALPDVTWEDIPAVISRDAFDNSATVSYKFSSTKEGSFLVQDTAESIPGVEEADVRKVMSVKLSARQNNGSNTASLQTKPLPLEPFVSTTQHNGNGHGENNDFVGLTLKPTSAPQRVRHRTGQRAGAVVTSRGRNNSNGVHSENINTGLNGEKTMTRKEERRHRRQIHQKLMELLQMQEERIALLRKRMSRPKAGSKASVNELQFDSAPPCVGFPIKVQGTVVLGSGKTQKVRPLNDSDDWYVWYRQPGRIEVGFGQTYVPTALDLASTLCCECQVNRNKASEATVSIESECVQVAPKMRDIILSVIMQHKEHIIEVELTAAKLARGGRGLTATKRVTTSAEKKRRFSLSAMTGVGGKSSGSGMNGSGGGGGGVLESLVLTRDKVKYRVGKKTISKAEVGHELWAVPIADSMYDFHINMGSDKYMLSAKQPADRDLAVVLVNALCGRSELSRVLKMDEREDSKLKVCTQLVVAGTMGVTMVKCGPRGLKEENAEESAEVKAERKEKAEEELSERPLQEMQLEKQDAEAAVPVVDNLLMDNLISNEERQLLFQILAPKFDVPSPVLASDDMLGIFDDLSVTNSGGSMTLTSIMKEDVEPSGHSRDISISGGFASIADLALKNGNGSSPHNYSSNEKIEMNDSRRSDDAPPRQAFDDPFADVNLVEIGTLNVDETGRSRSASYNVSTSSPSLKSEQNVQRQRSQSHQQQQQKSVKELSSPTLPKTRRETPTKVRPEELDLDETRVRGNFVYDRCSGLWYNRSTEYLFDEKTKLYCKSKDGPWYRYDKKCKKLVQESVK